jgi:hypothetical protein
MASSASRLFEVALTRLPDMSAPASTHFDALIKARKKAAAPAPVAEAADAAADPVAPAPKASRGRKKKAAASAPAAKPENPQVSFGRGSGDRPDDFADRHPHLVHGGTFKLQPGKEGTKSTPIGPNNPMYHSEALADATEYKVHNPLETVARIGYNVTKKTTQSDQAGWDSPNHRHHAGYIFTQMAGELHPETSQNAAFHAKKPRGMHPQIAIRNLAIGNWLQGNQHQAAKDNPRTLGEHMDRIRQNKGGSASIHASNLTGAAFRMEGFTRGMNRLFHVARGMGDKFHGDMDHLELHDALMNHDLEQFSGRREIQGFHPEHLGSKHNPMSAGDFDAGGKKTWKPHPFFSQAKGVPHPIGNAKADNMVDFAEHLTKVPISHGGSKAIKDSGGELVSHYLPKQAQSHRENYARLKGIKLSGE